MTRAIPRLLLVAALASLGLGACSRHEAADGSSPENRQLEVTPLKPEAPVAPPPLATAPKPTPPANVMGENKEPSLPPDAQVQEDAAAVGMTSRRSADAGAATAPAERPSSMQNLY